MSAKLWAGRFAADVTGDVLDYTLTVDIDTRLISYDLWQSIAHTIMLVDNSIVRPADGAAIVQVLLELDAEHREGRLELRRELEDVHLNLETMVIERAGAQAGGRMHTARSRNDQVATDMRMYLRDAVLNVMEEVVGFVADLAERAANETENVIPGYTHGQPAQPVSVAFWRLGHAQALLRDLGRLRDALVRCNESPLGSCALAGTSFPIDRRSTARLLGFDRPMANALDATSARDFVQEIAAALAVLGTHMSRLAEEVVVWSGHETALVTVPDSFSTGSSIMPQKKNPVVAELARARTGRLYGTLMQVLVVAKSVGLGYSCDLQEDKPLIWDALDVALSTVRLMRRQTDAMVIDHHRGERLCYENFSTATELANHLTSEHEVPFREAHRIVGETVAELIAKQATLRDTDLVVGLLARRDVVVAADRVTKVVSPKAVMARHGSEGGTGPQATVPAIESLREAAGQIDVWRKAQQDAIASARQETLTLATERLAQWLNDDESGTS